jgi:hypothetical protein
MYACFSKVGALLAVRSRKGLCLPIPREEKMTMVIFFLAISLGTALFYFEPVRAPTFEKQA